MFFYEAWLLIEIVKLFFIFLSFFSWPIMHDETEN